ncbi:MAG: antitoxin family protein [Caldisphaeraceae archaeon]|nr:antitoxin family protein [Caldisphaeraceae archaeon]
METLRLEKANCFDAYSNIRWSLGLSRIIRVKYENGVLKPLTSINLEEGKEYKVIVEEDIDELIKKYKGILGKSSIKEFQELEEEAQVQ